MWGNNWANACAAFEHGKLWAWERNWATEALMNSVEGCWYERAGSCDIWLVVW